MSHFTIDTNTVLIIVNAFLAIMWIVMFIRKGGVIYLVLATLFLILIVLQKIAELLEHIIK